MRKKSYIFTKTHEVDKDKFAELLLAAKGSRTMKDFADLCGANPSTFTRIIQKTNKGASSTELIEAIAEHAAPKSKVTIEALADANGYTVREDIGLKVDELLRGPANAERLVRDVVTQALIDRGQEVRMGHIRYDFGKHMQLRPDALIMTSAFGKENEIWFVDSLVINNKAKYTPGVFASTVRHRAFDRISRFSFISMSRIDLCRPSRFTLAVFDKDVYEAIVDEFEETNVPTDISIMLIDAMNSTIAAEFMLPHVEKGCQDSYFMTTPVVSNSDDYLSPEDYDDED